MSHTMERETSKGSCQEPSQRRDGDTEGGARTSQPEAVRSDTKRQTEDPSTESEAVRKTTPGTEDDRKQHRDPCLQDYEKELEARRERFARDTFEENLPEEKKSDSERFQQEREAEIARLEALCLNALDGWISQESDAHGSSSMVDREDDGSRGSKERSEANRAPTVPSVTEDGDPSMHTPHDPVAKHGSNLPSLSPCYRLLWYEHVSRIE